LSSKIEIFNKNRNFAQKIQTWKNKNCQQIQMYLQKIQIRRKKELILPFSRQKTFCGISRITNQNFYFCKTIFFSSGRKNNSMFLKGTQSVTKINIFKNNNKKIGGLGKQISKKKLKKNHKK